MGVILNRELVSEILKGASLRCDIEGDVGVV